MGNKENILILEYGKYGNPLIIHKDKIDFVYLDKGKEIKIHINGESLFFPLEGVNARTIKIYLTEIGFYDER